MSKDQTIAIQNEFDIIEARMQVRTLARRVGLDLFDQARISLATSTLAIMLGMETAKEGQIDMCCLEENGRKGVQVVCMKPKCPLQSIAAGVLDDAKQMVDDLLVEAPSVGGVKVTMIKWVGGKRSNSEAASPARTTLRDI